MYLIKKMFRLGSTECKVLVEIVRSVNLEKGRRGEVLKTLRFLLCKACSISTAAKNDANFEILKSSVKDFSELSVAHVRALNE